MTDVSAQQNIILIVSILFVAALVLYSRFGKGKNKDLAEKVFGIKMKTKETDEKKPARPKEKNGTKADLTLFASELLRVASKNGMRVVLPAIVEYKGQSSRLTAFLVSPSGVLGIFCVGFGGTVKSSGEKEDWKQRINGEDKTIANPLVSSRQQYELVKAAMDEAGIKAEFDVVVVFTNPAVKLEMPPSASVYTSKAFFDHIKNTDALKRGELDVEKITQDLAVLADIKGKKAALRGRKK